MKWRYSRTLRIDMKFLNEILGRLTIFLIVTIVTLQNVKSTIAFVPIIVTFFWATNALYYMRDAK